MDIHDGRTSRFSALALVLSMLTLLMLGTTLVAGEGEKVTEALTNGKVSYDLRWRFEHVDQDGFRNKAKASTARLRLGYNTGTFFGLSAFAEFEGIFEVGADSYNSTDNGKTNYPVVADPEEEELNQGYLAYTKEGRVSLKLGKQRIKLDNDRFIGNVGWRQNEQTFDAFTAVGHLNKKTTLKLGYINNVNRIFGEHHSDPARADVDTSFPWAHVAHEFPLGTVAGYTHFIEIEDAPLTSHRNIGARFIGSHKFSDQTTLHYTAEYADQTDYEDGASIVDAEYYLAELGLTARKITYKVGYEVLGGDGEYGFATPFATLHAFNGWTDRFLATPVDGLEDLYLLVTRKWKGCKLLAVYHDFSADDGGGDFGDELGLLATRKLGKHFDAGIKYATYDADDSEYFAALPTRSISLQDTDIFWVWMRLHR
jgi:hypothetical protein